MNKTYYIYIMTNPKGNVLYTGVTNNLERRVWEHKNHLLEGFTKKYNCTNLVYFEEGENINSAIEREKQLKNWHRKWKINLIKNENPKFEDLAEAWFNLDPETSSG